MCVFFPPIFIHKITAQTTKNNSCACAIKTLHWTTFPGAHQYLRISKLIFEGFPVILRHFKFCAVCFYTPPIRVPSFKMDKEALILEEFGPFAAGTISVNKCSSGVARLAFFSFSSWRSFLLITYTTVRKCLDIIF